MWIVFDLDGTLADTLKDLASACEKALKDCHLPGHTLDEYRYFIGNGVKNLVMRAIGDQDCYEQARAIFDAEYEKNCLRDTNAYPGMPEAIHQLKTRGFHLAVYTNKPDHLAKKIVRHLYGDDFDLITGQKEGVPIKPDPAGLATMLDYQNTIGIMVGDSDVDMYTGSNLGFYNIGVTWGNRDQTELKNAGAKKIANSPEHLTEVIAETMRESLILRFDPVYKKTVWGGQRLKELGMTPPYEKTGEAWCVSAHPNGETTIKSGLFQNKTLSWLYAVYPAYFNTPGNEDFPLLIKWIDAHENLSVQVHPNEDYAQKVEHGHGKNECWYIVKASPGTKLLLGHTANSRTDMADAITRHQLPSRLREIPIHPGEFYYVPSGTVHAIEAGTVIYEIQETSDITYRLYDYDRVDDQGQKRPLHIDKALDVITFPFQEPQVKKTVSEDTTTYQAEDRFTVKRISLHGTYHFISENRFTVISVLEGSFDINNLTINRGETILLSALLKEATLTGHAEIIQSATGGS